MFGRPMNGWPLADKMLSVLEEKGPRKDGRRPRFGPGTSKFYTAVWWIVRTAFEIFLGLRVEGQEHIPDEGGVILASNHVSYFDPPIIGVASPRELSFLAKRELFSFPPFRVLITRLNAIPLDRSGMPRAALKTVIELIRAGKVVLLFPEGTRSRSGELGEARAGVGMISVTTGRPVVPVCVEGTGRIFKALLGLGGVRVRFGAPVSPDRIRGGRKDRYRHLSDQVMKEIAKLRT